MRSVQLPLDKETDLFKSATRYFNYKVVFLFVFSYRAYRAALASNTYLYTHVLVKHRMHFTER